MHTPQPTFFIKKFNRILFEPPFFITSIVQSAMMNSAKWNSKFVAWLLTDRARLSKAKVVGLRW
tara:strand:- start:481 stop:672 length:192 start_codon:yes stop_codon:yes gene_type:complete